MIRPGRRRAGPVAALIAAVAIGGCGGSSSGSTGRHSTPPAGPSRASTGLAATTTTTSTTATTAQTTAHTTALSTPTAQASATAKAVAGSPSCLTRSLRLSLVSGAGAAGTAFFYYDLTNVGPGACAMIGYPGVAVLDAHGHIVQHPATRGAAVSTAIRLVNLNPGQRARFLVNSDDVIPSPGCPRPYRGTTLQVYPPNQRTAILAPRAGDFCNLRVGPVQPAG